MAKTKLTLFTEEITQKQKLDLLMADWKRQVSPFQVFCHDDGKFYPADSFFARDGFLPYYYKQKQKVLFMSQGKRAILRAGIISK